jgi:hypothetical protein
MQEESSGVIVMDEDEPQAIDELLTYLYSLSDRIGVLSLHDTMFHPNGPGSLILRIARTDEELSECCQELEKLANDVKYLPDVLVTADKYQVSDLATLAGQKIEERLSVFRNRAAELINMPMRLISAFSEALYFEHEIPPFAGISGYLSHDHYQQFRHRHHL